MAATDSAIPGYAKEPRWDPTQEVKASVWGTAWAASMGAPLTTGNVAWTVPMGASSLAAAGLALAAASAF